MSEKVTPKEVLSFVTEATKFRSNWLSMAERSWRELKKVQANGSLWSLEANQLRKRARYPIWYSIYKIRQAILLARVGIPIGRDTTQDGTDSVGATAAICLERLATSLPKNFDFFDALCSCRNDFEATDFGFMRAYYQCDEVFEKVKEYIQPQKTAEGVEFFDTAGNVIRSDEIHQDDEGYFVEHPQTVAIENEKIVLKPVLYRRVLVDPCIERWEDVKRLAFEISYSEREFIRIFGRAAFDSLPKPDPSKESTDTNSAEKRQNIVVYEYWDFYDRECYWIAKEGSDFIKPKAMLVPSEERDESSSDETDNGLYNLDRFFPCPKPLLTNQPTDGFWPICEYSQLVEIFESIHHIFTVIFRCTRAIRPRLLYDNNVEGLKAAIAEASDNDAIGVSNLTQALMAAGGSLENVVQYVPIEKIVASLGQMCEQLEQRLETVRRLTGTGDLLQGMSSDGSGKTLGERQIEEKYALNQIYESQRKVAEFVRDCYQLMTEMALKNFSDASLAQYIMPNTLSPEHQHNYQAAIGMLKETRKSRFRIELETDSTIALNEEYDRKMRIEFVNAMTTALEKTAQTCEQMPELAIPELHAMKFLIQGFPRSGKLFQGEVTEAINQTIERIKNAPQKPDPAMLKLEQDNAQFSGKMQMEQMKLELDAQATQAEIASKERIVMFQSQAEQSLAGLSAQMEQMKLAYQNQKASESLQLEYQKIAASITEAQEKLAVERDGLLVELRKIAAEKEIGQFKAMMDQQVNPMEQQLQAQEQQLEAARLQLQSHELAITDSHVQADNMLQQMRLQLDAMALKVESSKPPELPPITIHMPEPVSKSKTLKIKRDAAGNIASIDAQDLQGPIK